MSAGATDRLASIRPTVNSRLINGLNIASDNARYWDQFVAAGGRKKFPNFAEIRGSSPTGYQAPRPNI